MSSPADPLSDLVEMAFQVGFDGRFRAVLPWCSHGLLVCPGSISGSALDHRCRFVSVDSTWCWEHPGAISDTIRRPRSFGYRFASVTIVDLSCVNEVVVVHATSRRGAHHLTEARDIRIENGETVVGRARTARRGDGRWLSALDAMERAHRLEAPGA